MKKRKNVETTTDRKEYKILNNESFVRYVYECCVCPMSDHCRRYKHKTCKPDRVRERNWKSQRETQYKIS